MAPSAIPDLPRPPFIHIHGLPNFRDAGGYPITNTSDTNGSSAPAKMVRKGVLFRASEPSKLSAEGEAQLNALGIKEVYDLRSAVEIDRGIREGHGWAVREWDGARRNFVPVFLDQDYSPEALALRIKNYSDETVVGFVKAYMDILHAASSKDNPFSPFRTILAHLSAAPSSTATSSSENSTPPPPPPPVLIHCTAGKDRTGVIFALILSLCGVEDDIIAHEYNLTEIGLRERHEELIKHLLNNPSMTEDPVGVTRMIGAQKISMLTTLTTIREQYGTIEDAVVKLGLLSPDEIVQLRRNLVVDADEAQLVPWRRNAELLP